MDELSAKHRIFIEAYCGDAIEAMKIAGLTKASSPAHLKKAAERLMSEPLIIKGIKERSRYMTGLKKVIADRESRQTFWSEIMFNNDPNRKEEFDANGVPIKEGNIPLPIRLKASELLGKSEADFVERIDMKSQVTISDIVLGSYEQESARSLEDIEAQYVLHKQRQLSNTPVIEDQTDDQPSNLDDLL